MSAVSAPVFFQWRVTGRRPLPVTRTLPFARAARDTLIATGLRFGIERWPDDFHHAAPGEGTSAFFLPLDGDGDGLIDGFACLHPAGLPDFLLPAFAAGGHVGLPGIAGEGPAGGWRLEPLAMGPAEACAFQTAATVWRTITPFVTPRERLRGPGEGRRERAGRSLPEQVVSSLARLGLPEPLGLRAEPLTLVADQALAAADFALAGGGHAPPPRDAEAAFVTLAFAAPVVGPILIGHGAHCGLGHFAPVA
jgi:CRISPR-associated protein Csb2